MREGHEKAREAWPGGRDLGLYGGDARYYKNLSSLKLCRECFELYGPICLGDGQSVEQRCFCGPAKGDEKWCVDGRYVNDFNTEYELCYCCGLEVIPSGSRWSSFYCNACRGRIHILNERMGRCVVPRGRHSMMNGISLSGARARDEKAVAEFAAGVNRMNMSIDEVRSHQKKIAGMQAASFELAEDSPITVLLEKSRGRDLDELKGEAFLELIAVVFGTAAKEAMRLCEDVN